MAEIVMEDVTKVYPGDVRAVSDLNLDRPMESPIPSPFESANERT
jgi:hypothetical protein